MCDEELLFTEKEWNEAVPKVVEEMQAYISPFITALSVHNGNEGDDEYGELQGTGTYIRLSGKTYVLTNEHVARARSPESPLLHQLQENDRFHIFQGNHYAYEPPLDLAVLPVSDVLWSADNHQSKAVTTDMLSLAHDPELTELLMFGGFSGERSGFHFNTLTNRWTGSTAREAPLPEDERFTARFHFGIDYRPDRATAVIGNQGLPDPHGFSGSAVWDTGFVSARMAGVAWTPELARVTGILWGWPSSHACLVATRGEYLRSFLLSVTEQEAIEEEP